MNLSDKVYGSYEFREPVIIEIIKSPELQRLKGVSQSGWRFYQGEDVSRFEHSVGCAILLDKYGAPLEEVVFGLLHDVSHTAFSHCIEYVLGSQEKHDYQDSILNETVRRSSIPDILEKHGLDTDYILDENNFPLQENELPDICADRIDYALRDLLAAGLSSRQEINRVLRDLKAADGQWFFNEIETAKVFADKFYLINTECYSGLKSAVMFRTVSSYLKHALEKGYVEEKDLFGTDRQVVEKINTHLKDDRELDRYWSDINKRQVSPSDEKIRVVCKSRIIDPKIKREKGFVRLSELYPEWKKVVEKEMIPKEYYF